MFFFNRDGAKRKPQAMARGFAGAVLAIVICGWLTGCSPLTWHRSPQQPRAVPWLKPEKPEPRSTWFKSLFMREKERPRNPSEWLDQKRPEWGDQE